MESHGIENVPASGPAILVANHGGVLPVDGAMLCLDLLRRSTPPRIPRPITDYFVPRLPVVSTLFSRLGVVSGTRANVRRLLEAGELLVLFPEGVSGPAKPFRERYQLQHWSVGFAELALRHRVAVIPVAIVGAEESWPLAAKLTGVRALGVPYLPVPATLLPLPTHYRIEYGTPIFLGDDDPDDPSTVASAAATVREKLEHLLADARTARRGVFR